jgi:hypothetical protein
MALLVYKISHVHEIVQRGESMNHDNMSEIARQIIDKFELLKQRLYVIMDDEQIYVKKN